MTLIKGKMHVHTNIPGHPNVDWWYPPSPYYSIKYVTYPEYVTVANPETALMNTFELRYDRFGASRRLTKDMKQVLAKEFSFMLLDIIKPARNCFGFVVALVLTPEGEKLAAWLMPGQWKPILQGED